MRKILSSKLVAAVAVGAVVVTGTGVAYAWWTTNGSGSVTGATGDATATDNVTLTGTVTGDMIPGAVAANDVELTVANPNTYSVSLDGQTVTLTGATCTIGATVVNVFSEGWFVLDDATVDSTTIVPPATTEVPTTDLASEDVSVKLVNDTDESQDDCQGADLVLSFTVS